MLVFMTDGLPTVGESNAEKIVANIKKAKGEDIRLFTFGVGYDVNTTLLDKLAAENSGAADYVEPKEDLEIKVSNFFTKVSAPVLSDLQIDFGGAETELVYPRKLTDLFKGAQITLMGRYKNDNDLQNTTLRLTGKAGTENRAFTYQNLDFPRRSEENNFLPRLWATRRVGWILEQIRANGETKELRDEVAELGTRYGIVTPYTSYLATDGSFESVRRDAAGNFTVNKEADKKLQMRSGQDAVQLSVQQNAQQSNASLAPSSRNVFVQNSLNNQFVGTKNFYNQSGVWQDAEFKPEANLSEVKLQFASDEYFELINREKELAQFLALGEQVIVVWKGKVYRIIK
jgi:Ca-activated chloride channel family protein